MLDWSTHAHGYQNAAAAHLFERHHATLWLQPGYGKTGITLHAFKALVDAGQARHMLVVAPLRVVQTVWAQEIENWATLNGLRAARLHGNKKESQIRRRDVNVWLINYEGIPWLASMAKKGKIPFAFDVITFDEIRRMKNPQGKRFKMMRPIAALAKYRWGLTGTPASNGLMDLFGQFLILDDGEALGTRVTRFRSEFFEQGFDGFTWLPRPGAEDAIEARIKDYVFRAEGHLDLPDFVYDNRTITLDAKARKIYAALKSDLITSLEGMTITAANAAVLVGKLKQMANGRVYDEDRKVHEVHTAKKDALLELVEELGDEQLLIAYEYNHDLEQIREALGDIPYLGAGVSEKTALAHVAEWNAGEVRIMAAHPASAGHGLNLQKSGAHHILWWGPTFDLDHYIQFNDRLRRQGNTADAVIVHTFVTEHSVDETAVKSRADKDAVQTAFLNALTGEFGPSITVETNGSTQEITMTQLSFKPDAQQGQQAAPAPNPFAQGGQQPATNPFAQNAAPSAPQHAPEPPQPATNPFAQNAAPSAPQHAPEPPQPATNPFAQGGQQPAANPFAQGGQQVQNIQQDVAANPPATPDNVANPFAHGGQQIEDAQVVQETAPQTNPFAGGQPQPNITATPEDRQSPEDATGWKDTTPEKAEDSPTIEVPSAAPSGMVPLYTFIPADKLDKVMAAIGRAIK